jgi:hypothetical protein
MTALTMLSIESDLHRLRPSNFHPPDGFYPKGASDAFWTRNEELFYNKFRFSLGHFHRLIRVMGLEDKQLLCGAGRNKHRAVSCLLVVLRRLSYPCRFWEMTEDFRLSSNQICEIFHTILDFLFDQHQAFESFTEIF